MKINPSQNINFRGGANVVKDTWLAKFSMKFADAGGEKVTNIVNAVGKGTVAPLFIAFNPFSKEDKETKIYSAWKHPIEAVITIGIQLLVLKNIGKYLNKLSNEGKLSVDLNLKGILKDTDKFKSIEKRLGVFKDRVGFIGALAVIPVATSIVNWAYPKIMKKIDPMHMTQMR